MAERGQIEPLSIGDAFPAGNATGEWVVVLSMAMNDLVTLDGEVHDHLESGSPSATYFLRLLCGTLRELWRLFQVADEREDVGQLVKGLVPEARTAYEEVRELFVRPEATEANPEPRSWAELHLKDVRDRTFHYPQICSEELGDALSAAADEQARLLDSGSRPFQFADVAALRVSFGDITNAKDRERFEEIVAAAKRIQELLIPVVWNALGVHLRALGLDPQRLNAPDQEDEPAEPQGPRNS
jgi:hypothetical protein